MRHFDVFNGDADGICALRQLHLAEPLEATLITGLKRDIALLKDLSAAREPAHAEERDPFAFRCATPPECPGDG